jgi:hypothetical protein
MESDTVGERFELALDPSYWDVPVNLPVRRFNVFSRKLDRQLERLVHRWIRLAAPQGSQCRRQCDGTSLVEPTS